MYKILIVDEEKIIIDSIKKIISDNLNDANVVGYATTGRDAVAKAMDIKPDIILIEIKISGINGFEAIRIIKEFLPKVHIVILSSYDYFDFAREAINLGVDDYILKPINNTALINTLNSIINVIKEDEKYTQNKIEEEIFIKNITEFAENSFIYSVLFNGKINGDILRYKDIFDLTDTAYIMNIEISIAEGSKNANDIYTESKFKCIKEVISKYHRCIIGPQILNRILLVVLEDSSDMNNDKQKIESMELANLIILKLKNVFRVDVMIGIGNIHNIENLHESYEESLKILHYDNGQSNTIHFKDLRIKKIINYKDYRDKEQQLIASIKLGKDESLDLFSILLDMLKVLEEEERKNKIIELLVVSCYAANTIKEKEDQLTKYSVYFEEIKMIKENELLVWAIRKFQYILKTVRISKNDKISNITSMAIKYIEEHYNEEISLDDVSKYVSLTPQYFSKVFKDETGYNFVEWITNIRVKNAKDLMNSTDKTIKEVCYLVGYHDPNYFSRIFKKIVGISPTEYLKGKGRT